MTTLEFIAALAPMVAALAAAAIGGLVLLRLERIRQERSANVSVSDYADGKSVSRSVNVSCPRDVDAEQVAELIARRLDLGGGTPSEP